MTLSEAVTTELIINISAVVIALIGALFGFLGQRAARKARDEVINNHPVNIRDDMTASFQRIFAALDATAKWQEASDRHTDAVDRRIDAAAGRMDHFDDSLNILRDFLGRTDNRVQSHAKALNDIAGTIPA